MKKRNLWGILVLLAVMLICVSMPVEAKSYKTYKVSTSTNPLDKNNKAKAKKDKKTKTTYMLRSYLEKIEKNGGGTLVLKKGTYKIYDNLFVPSNTTIKFEKGVKIVPQSKSKVNGVFQLLPPSKTSKKNYAKGYKSSKNVKFIGDGSTVIDLGKTDTTAIYMSHNDKVEISGIQFKKACGKRYIIELIGARNVKIDKCKFEGKTKKETAISIDIPAKKKKQTRSWCKMDDTVNKSVSITNCKFNKLYRAIATLRYVDKKYQDKFVITGNTITNIDNDAIRAINWSNCKISNNKIKTVGTGGTIKGETKLLKRGIYLAGVQNPTVTNNTFEDLPRAIEFNVYKNTDANLKKYAPTKNKFTTKQLNAMLDTNKLIHVREYVLRVYSKSGGTPDSYYYPDDSEVFYISPNDTPYRNTYVKNDKYNSNTKHYYLFRAVMDQIERNGGGTIVVKKGTYNITNEIPITSNTTIKLEDGVIMKKAKSTGTDALEANNGIFAFVDPKYYQNSSLKYSGYNGIHNIVITGPEKGTATLDIASFPVGIGIVMAHSKDVEIKNLTFKNGNGGHYIELDASQNVKISGCHFEGHKDSDTNNKEAINLDTPDKATLGFIRDWTSYDKTANLNVTITGNTFKNLECAVGSHSYSVNKPHTNIIIENNIIENCDGAAIQVMNWKNLTIQKNTIMKPSMNSTVDQWHEFAITLRGVNNLVIKDNTITNGNKLVRIVPAKMTGKNTIADNYAQVPNVISQAQLNDMISGNKFTGMKEPVVTVYPVLNGTPTTYDCISK